MKVLLARPHDFVVAEMRGWLTSLGVEPVRLESLEGLDTHLSREVAGVVVSAAVTSSVNVTVGAALAAVRKRFLPARLMIAGMATVESARTGLAAELKSHGLSLRGIHEPAAWGDQNVALYIQDTDFKAERLAALTKAAQQHLRLR